MPTDLSEWMARIAEASRRIYALVQQTPVAPIEDDLRLDSARPFLKLEHLQRTGSNRVHYFLRREYVAGSVEQVVIPVIIASFDSARSLWRPRFAERDAELQAL